MKITEINSISNKEIELVLDNSTKEKILKVICEDYSLENDIDITEEKLDEIKQKDRVKRVKEYSLELLSRRKRTYKEIENKLREKGFEEKPVLSALNELVEDKYIDDYEFSKWWINMRRSNKPKGDFAIYSELKEKGVDTDIIDEAFEKLYINNLDDERELALTACRSMLRSYSELPYPTARRRLTAFLRRKGFSWDVIKSIADEYL